jgi:hypothetical protein
MPYDNDKYDIHVSAPFYGVFYMQIHHYIENQRKENFVRLETKLDKIGHIKMRKSHFYQQNPLIKHQKMPKDKINIRKN